MHMFSKTKKYFWFFIGIILVSSILRLWNIGKVPIAPDWDEAALGYNAYSIMETGRDEYGVFLPIVLRSFDDYKPALYTYLIIPFIKIFDVSVISVRLPSAIFGIFTVIATFYLARILFEKSEKKEIIALLASGFLGISPWHIQFSRIGFESNAGVALNVFSALFFLMGLKKEKYLIPSVFCMAFNLYMYQSEKVFTPLLVLSLVIIYRKELLEKSKKILGICTLLGFILMFPLLFYTISNKEVFARAKGVSVFSDQTSYLKNDVLRVQIDKEKGDILGLVVDNRRLLYIKSILSGYLSHYDLNWLFVRGDIARHHAPDAGLLYIWELPFLFVGIYYLFFGNYNKKTKMVIFTWFFLAPIPASITSGVPHAVRTLNFLPTFQIFSAIGLCSSYLFIREKISKRLIRYCIFSSVAIFILLNIIYYLDQYFIQQNYFTAYDWQYGYQRIVPEVKKAEDKYNQIIVSNEPPMDQSYMFFLFYLKYSPREYLRETKNVSGGFRENHIFGKFEFRPINWKTEKKDSRSLYIGRPSDFPADLHPIETVLYPNGTEAMKIIGEKK